MKLKTIYLKGDSSFSGRIGEWATKLGVETVDYNFKSEDQAAEGLLLINENQTIEKDMDDIHSLFDKKHLPTQKIDINGTLQVALSNFEMWLNDFKCKNILILGSDTLIKNKNLDRFLSKLKTS